MQLTLDLCEKSTQRPGERVSRQWWEQAGIDLDAEKKRVAPAAEAATDSESKSDLVVKESSGARGSSGAEWSGVEWSGEEG